jgi:hypothetical protein
MSTCKSPETAPSNHSLKFIILSMDTQFLEYLKYMNILTSSDILGVGLISEQILALQS